MTFAANRDSKAHNQLNYLVVGFKFLIDSNSYTNHLKLIPDKNY